jgi:hypothetical protein
MMMSCTNCCQQQIKVSALLALAPSELDDDGFINLSSLAQGMREGGEIMNKDFYIWLLIITMIKIPRPARPGNYCHFSGKNMQS